MKQAAGTDSKHLKGGSPMKFYDRYRPYILDRDYDRSYPSPEKQLLWRLDDLADRLEELLAAGALYRSDYVYTEDAVRYALPKDLWDVDMVEQAIELAKDDLVNVYGLPDPDQIMCDEAELFDDICKGQLSMEKVFLAGLLKAA